MTTDTPTRPKRQRWGAGLLRRPDSEPPEAWLSREPQDDAPDTRPGRPPSSQSATIEWPFAKARVVIDAEAERSARSFITRYFFGTAAFTAAGTAALLGWYLSDPFGTPGAFLLGLIVLVWLHCLVALRLDGRFLAFNVGVVMVGGGAVILFAAHAFDWGIRVPGLGFLGLFACLLGALSGLRLGVATALLATAAVVGLWAFGPDARGTMGLAPDPLQVGVQILQIVASLVTGLMIARVLARYVQSSSDREQRFRGLLKIAADVYWEIDSEHRLLTVSRGNPGPEGDVPDLVGTVAWERPEFSCEPDVLDALLADLQSRVPFRDRPVRWAGRDRERDLLISGEPRRDEHGRFRGYWGVARDVTADVRARRALQAVEHRYQELFARIPTPLVVHRSGRVIDANAAALMLFGHPSLKGLLGQDLLSVFESGDSRERARRGLEHIDTRPLGEALPVADYRLVGRGQRRLAARAAAVRIDVEGDPATLSIFVDDTERRAAEDAVRRSEAMLSHLVASSPDVITLTELSTGCYAMVNQTFERLMGWKADDVIGKTSLELAIWQSEEDRTRFVSRLRQHGAVNDISTVFITRDGQPVQMRVSGARFTMDQREYLVINARDVSAVERVRLEREAILDNASIGIAVTRDRQFVLVNPFFEQVYGWPGGTLVGQPGRVVWPSDEDYAQLGAEIGPALSRGERVEFERMAHRRDGSLFLARMIGKAVDPTHPARGGTVWLMEDVTQRRQVEQALARARDDAEAASRAKSAFLANTSHELRTPLNGLLGLSRLARAPGLDEAVRTGYLAQLETSAQSLAAIISDILDFSKIEAGKLHMEDSDFDLAALLRTLQQAWAELGAPAGLSLDLELGEGLQGQVRGDALRVRQILDNYLSNAVKFTGRGAVRMCAFRVDATMVRVDVHDTGPGIEPHVQERLFKPFTQADESTTRRFGGTGLGLSICRELATLMGGSVGLRSQPGQGSTFWVELRLPTVASAPPSALSTPAATMGAETASLRGARVLVVEDNPVNMLIGAALLEQWGVEVRQATDGQQALAAVERAAAEGRPFHAVLMDVQMPVMSGHEATRVLRQRHSVADLPVIALTAAALVSEREQALAAGMNDFLTKPIDADRLRKTLERWVRLPA